MLFISILKEVFFKVDWMFLIRLEIFIKGLFLGV